MIEFIPLALGVLPGYLTERKALAASQRLKEHLKTHKDPLPVDHKHPDKRIKVIRTKKELLAWANDPNNIPKKGFRNEIYRAEIKVAADSLGHNAFFVAPPNPAGTPIVVVGAKGNFNHRKIFDHEYGHFLDYAALKSKDLADFNKKQQQRGKGFFHQIIDPSTNPTLITEIAAWDHSPHKEGDPVRESALDTYRASAQTPRNIAAGALGIAGYLLLKHKKANLEYYDSHKHQILAHAKQYRMMHQMQLKKHQKAYHHKVSLGLIRPQKRIHVGNDYTFMRR